MIPFVIEGERDREATEKEGLVQVGCNATSPSNEEGIGLLARCSFRGGLQSTRAASGMAKHSKRDQRVHS